MCWINIVNLCKTCTRKVSVLEYMTFSGNTMVPFSPLKFISYTETENRMGNVLYRVRWICVAAQLIAPGRDKSAPTQIHRI